MNFQEIYNANRNYSFFSLQFYWTSQNQLGREQPSGSPLERE